MNRPAEALREGFTTGSAAAAATLGALHRFFDGCHHIEVSVPLPPGATAGNSSVHACRLRISVVESGHGLWASANPEFLPEGCAWAAVVKDGGDDPDATHGARIESLVVLDAGNNGTLHVSISGGEGVGKVTLPGLPVPVGEAAINPGPIAQIELAVRETCAEYGFHGSVRVFIRVPDGKRIARHTLNARLGIVDGISILGTQGTVRPFSHDAWKKTIEQELEIAAQAGCTHIGVSTGRRSERLLMREFPTWAEQAFIQSADFIGYTIQCASGRFESLTWGCFFGKLLKVAQGHTFTHARHNATDFSRLAEEAARSGLDATASTLIQQSNTAAQALEYILADTRGPFLLARLASQANLVLEQCAERDRAPTLIHIRLFHTDGRELARS